MCNLPQPVLKREDILSEVRWAVIFSMMNVPILSFIWSLAVCRVFKIEFSDTLDYVYQILFYSQVGWKATKYQVVCHIYALRIIVLLPGLQGLLVFLVYGLGQRSIRQGILRKKYRPSSSKATILTSKFITKILEFLTLVCVMS